MTFSGSVPEAAPRFRRRVVWGFRRLYATPSALSRQRALELVHRHSSWGPSVIGGGGSSLIGHAW
jgi:hypothetical protein